MCTYSASAPVGKVGHLDANGKRNRAGVDPSAERLIDNVPRGGGWGQGIGHDLGKGRFGDIETLSHPKGE